MNNGSNSLLDFLASPEIRIVYIAVGVACFLCFIVYLIEKNNVKLRQKHNTRELNKLVNQVKEETQEVEKTLYDVPILEPIEELKEEDSSVEALESTEEEGPILESSVRDDIIVEPIAMDSDTSVPEIISSEPELEYTTIEPDQETAQLELKKITEELQRQEEIKQQEDLSATTSRYEEEQEENAIISLEELLAKSKTMYEANELTQYADDGDVPISLEELEKKVGVQANAEYAEEPFIIANVVPKEELVEENVSTVEEKTIANEVQNVVPPVEVIVKKFQSSPIISPIFGIEQSEVSANDMELENTANYEKLDAEIRRTNEFLMSLKDLQKKLD